MRDLHFSHFVVEMTKTRIIRLLNKPDNKKCTLFSLKKKYANILCWKSFYFYFVFFFSIILFSLCKDFILRLISA